jgi:hypothetical protein
MPLSTQSCLMTQFDFEYHRGEVLQLSARRADHFLNDEGEGDDETLPTAAAFASDYPPCTQSLPARSVDDDMFTDSIWRTSPDLALTQNPVAAPATVTPAASFPDTKTLEVYEIEIHSLLTFMFDCINNERLQKLGSSCRNSGRAHGGFHWCLARVLRLPFVGVDIFNCLFVLSN